MTVDGETVTDRKDWALTVRLDAETARLLRALSTQHEHNYSLTVRSLIREAGRARLLRTGKRL